MAKRNQNLERRMAMAAACQRRRRRLNGSESAATLKLKSQKKINKLSMKTLALNI